MNKTIRRRARKRLDEKIAGIRPVERYTVPNKGWIRAIRDAIGMTGPQLGKRLGLTPQAVMSLEKSEATGSIQLRSLRRVAEAMNCELVYALVPRCDLQEMVDRRARALAIDALGRVSHSMTLEGQKVDRDLEVRIADYIENGLTDRQLWDEV